MTGLVMVTRGGGCGGAKTKGNNSKGSEEISNGNGQQVSVLEVLLAAIRKSLVACRVEGEGGGGGEDGYYPPVHHMEIGWPTNVQHITHVTFDRFNGFLGLPVEFEVEVPCRVPSASASVFGVSAESMQCSYDSKGNSVPTILLLMQERLYSQEGLKAEGIFRINPENGQEEHVRDQLNRGIVPDDIDVHCVAGLIKAWFRELPSGVLDGLSPEEVLQCNAEEESVELVKQLKPTECALLNWAVELMADVVEEEEFNKMNARNIAMVFAPNMTQMADPLTALMHAVQVMNLLKTLITRTLREREETETGGYSPMSSHSSSGQSEEEFNSQQEMDTSCELRPPSDFDDHVNCSPGVEDHDEVEPLSDIEECFLRQLTENQVATKNLSGRQVLSESANPVTCASCKPGFGFSFADCTNEDSSSITSDEGDPKSRMNMTAVVQSTNNRSPSRESEMADDEIMVDAGALSKHVRPVRPLGETN